VAAASALLPPLAVSPAELVHAFLKRRQEAGPEIEDFLLSPRGTFLWFFRPFPYLIRVKATLLDRVPVEDKKLLPLLEAARPFLDNRRERCLRLRRQLRRSPPLPETSFPFALDRSRDGIRHSFRPRRRSADDFPFSLLPFESTRFPLYSWLADPHLFDVASPLSDQAAPLF